MGCILAEMLSGKPLFPGRDYHHQLNLILDVLGTPSLDDFYAISSHRSRDYLRALPFKKKKPFASLYPNANPDALDLLERMLAFNPRKRITVEECLAHPYLSPYVSAHLHSNRTLRGATGDADLVCAPSCSTTPRTSRLRQFCVSSRFPLDAAGPASETDCSPF